jgi:hypothetical protein
MEDVTPLNLEDSPKLFGMRYDQLVSITISLILSTQLYTWLSPIPIMGGHDLRLDLCILIGLAGPVYCLITLNHSASHWETLLNFYAGSSVYIPGPDPDPKRFLLDEQLPEFGE